MRTLPPLPEPEILYECDFRRKGYAYAAEQMRAYALAEREACAQVCEGVEQREDAAGWAAVCAVAIRARD